MPIYALGDKVPSIHPNAYVHPDATVIGDFSKALCLSGLRIGWMIERDPSRREQYLRARSYFTVSSTVLGERLATLALRNRNLIYDRVQRIAGRNLQLLDGLFVFVRGKVRFLMAKTILMKRR